MATKIQIRNLRKVYNTPGRRVHALEGVNLDIQDGEFLCFVGLSGCGKTTLLNILAGFVEITSGDILLDGKPINHDYDKGVVFQEYALFPWLTAKKNVEYGLKIRKVPEKEREEIAMRYLKLVRLEDFADFYPHNLSGGMRQRVAVARAMAYDPNILLMDEPFGALDAQTREDLQELTVDVWQKTKKTILYVTHNLSEAVYMGQRIVVFIPKPGRIVEIVPITLQRPRDALSREFIEIQRNINQLIRKF
jgi:NitT/TauT family transport system ATP-binding protein